ncbi:MAG: DUF1304 domain-containing protein [Steroidobacterales bacterium]
MSSIANIVIALIALLHVCILVLEMFLWDKPAGFRAFGQSQEAATASKVPAANQGLYNGFLVAGLYGAASTSNRTILMIRSVPAAIALALLLLS